MAKLHSVAVKAIGSIHSVGFGPGAEADQRGNGRPQFKKLRFYVTANTADSTIQFLNQKHGSQYVLGLLK